MKPMTRSETDVAQTIGTDRFAGHRKRLKRWITAILFVTVFTTGGIVWRGTDKTKALPYKTQKVQRGNLTVTVTATGTLEPTNQVDVGSELSGIVKTVEVDYNDHVKVGQILARLDTDKLKAKVLQSKAALDSSQAKVLETQATVKEAEDKLARLQHVWEISNQMVPSQDDMDAAQAALNRAKAAAATAKAQVSLSQAILDADQTDLSKAVILSPISGIVLTRNVEPGQTVAASFQAPVLFTLAEDLTKMELHVDVDEADVGRVKKGQPATFIVDSHPGRRFPARISQVRYGPQTVNGVVTYKTVLNVDNSDLSLRPGMTATADIVVNEVENAILVPNTALRFTPPAKEEGEAGGRRGLLNMLLPRRHGRRSRKTDSTTDSRMKKIWILKKGNLHGLDVATGETDGRMTAITGGDIEPGMTLVVDMTRSER